jgi:phage gpG-like protein
VAALSTPLNTSKVTVTQDHTAKVVKSIRALSALRLYVGVPDSTAARPPDIQQGKSSLRSKGTTEQINNAAIAFIQNNGSPKAKIPPRPFLTMGVAGVQEDIAKRMKVIATIAASGDRTALAKGFHALGIFVASAVRKKLTDGPWVPLAQRTIDARKSRRKSGKAGIKPLIDTGRLRAAITYVLRSK